MNAELKQGENGIVFADFRYFAQDKAMGNPYNTAFSVRVCSDGFGGVGKWECDRDAIAAFGGALADLYAFRRTSAVLEDISYGSRAEMTMDKTGHLTVSGVLYGSRAEQSLTFRFETDQTALGTFCAMWQKIHAAL